MRRGNRQVSRKLKIPLPRNKSELELLTKWYFGTEIHLKALWVTPGKEGVHYAQYEVREDYTSYHGIKKGWLFDESCIRGYDYSSRFWAMVIGNVQCGGIGRASYGQTAFRGHRHKCRLEALAESMRRDGPDPVRSSFVRLAAQSRGRREWRDSR